MLHHLPEIEILVLEIVELDFVRLVSLLEHVEVLVEESVLFQEVLVWVAEAAELTAFQGFLGRGGFTLFVRFEGGLLVVGFVG